VKTHASIKEAQRATGVPTGNICRSIRNQDKNYTAGGYKWKLL